MLHGDTQTGIWPVKVLVATGRATTRSALHALIESEAALESVGMAGDLPTTIRMVRESSADAVLIDRTVLGGVGFKRLSLLAGEVPGVAIFLVGMGDHPQMDAHARNEGAAGYVRLDQAPERISALLTSSAA